jgi:hypothetical protein
MCEDCKERDLELVEKQEHQFEELEVSNDSNEIILPPIELPFEYFENSENFQKGINDAMYLAGYITTIANTGISSTDVLEFLMNRETIEMNIKLAEINKSASIEVSKNQVLTIEKNQI